MNPLIAIITDFGTCDSYVAAMKGVILKHAPEARLVDITHEVAPQAVWQGAFLLAQVQQDFPENTIFFGVVDPRVGTDRTLVAIRSRNQIFVGPDNGLLSLAIDPDNYSAIELTPQPFWPKTISHTFHGRDILAPTVAALARGVRFEDLGNPCTIHRLEFPKAEKTGAVWKVQIIRIDRFGNAITNLPVNLFERNIPPTLHAIHLDTKIPFKPTYASGTLQESIFVPGSTGYFEIALREGSAADHLKINVGDCLTVASSYETPSSE